MSDICAIQSVLSCRVASFCSLNGRTGAAPAQRCWTEHHFIRTSWNLFPPELQQFLFEAARAVGIYSSAPKKFPLGHGSCGVQRCKEVWRGHMEGEDLLLLQGCCVLHSLSRPMRAQYRPRRLHHISPISAQL